MATEPITHFSDRAAAVSAALSLTGARPKAAEAMARTDEQLTARMAEFDDHYAAPNADKLATAVKHWAKRRKPSYTDLDAYIYADSASERSSVDIRIQDNWGGQWKPHYVSTPVRRRFIAARKLAETELISNHEKPEYSTAALIDSCRAEVREWFDNLAVEANEALAALDDVAREQAANTGRVDSILGLIDLATTPEHTISAYRRAVRAWTLADNDSNPIEPVARALAFNDVSDPEPEAVDKSRNVFDRVKAATSHLAGFKAVLFPAEVCALAVFDMNPVKAVIAGYGRFAPLADPLGEDIHEFERRLSAVSAAVDWLDERALRGSDRYRGKGWHSDHERFGMATSGASFADLKAKRSDVFDVAADDDADNVSDNYDLDPAANIYAE